MEKNICDFLNSSLTESEYYNSSMEDLISLKDYLLKLKAKDKEFLDLIKEPVTSMKEKCSWIGDVAFDALQKESTGKYLLSSIWLIPADGEHLIAHLGEGMDGYKDLAVKIPRIYMMGRRIKTHIRRQDDLKYVQDELHEIDKVGRSFYDGILHPQKSISENFNILYTPNVGMSVWTNDELVANYFVRQMELSDKPYLSEENKDQVLTRIQVKNRNI